MLNEPQVAKEVGDRARKFILENYTWNQIALKISSMYREIINIPHSS